MDAGNEYDLCANYLFTVGPLVYYHHSQFTIFIPLVYYVSSFP